MVALFGVTVFLGVLKTINCVPLSHFYPFGRNNGDERVPTNDDGSSVEIDIHTRFPYFNQQFDSLFVNTNGAISFTRVLSTYTPEAFPLSGNRKVVAPYWCDIDTNNGGDIWYYETTDHDILLKATEDAREVFPDQMNFKATWVFVATWENVAFYGASLLGTQKRNTFQCILITNGQNSFTTFLYNKIQWTTGRASGGNDDTGLGGTPAQVGFDAGDGFNFKVINESRTANVINVLNLGNTDIPGRYVFRIDTEVVRERGCSNDKGESLKIFPKYGTMFGGTEIFIGGPCVTAEDDLSLLFEKGNISATVKCAMHSKHAVKCITPLLYATGDFEITMVIVRDNQTVANVSGVYTFCK